MEVESVIILIEENSIPSTTQEIQTKQCKWLSLVYKIIKIITLLIFIALMLLLTYKIFGLNNLIAQNQPNETLTVRNNYAESTTFPVTTSTTERWNQFPDKKKNIANH